MDTIYLDNAATSFPKPAGMSARMKDYMDNIGATINRSVYASAADAGLVGGVGGRGVEDAAKLEHAGLLVHLVLRLFSAFPISKVTIFSLFLLVEQI